MISEISFGHNMIQSSEYPQEVYNILCELKLLKKKLYEKAER